MYAVIKSGGRQVRVEQGATVRLDKLEGERGKSIQFSEVLLIADGENIKVGSPTVAGAKVTGEIVEQGKGEKLLVYKFRRRKQYRKKTGHREQYTAVKITGINA